MITARRAPDREDIASLARGSGFGIIGTILSQFSLFAIVAMLAGVRGTAGVGLYSEAYAIFTLLTLVALIGFQTTLTRYVAMHLVSNEHGEIRRIVRMGLGATCLVATGLAAGLFAVAPWLAGTVLHQPELTTPLRLTAIALVPATYTKAASAVIQGYNELRDYAIASMMIEPAVRLALTVVAVVLTDRPIVGAMVALIISNTASARWAGKRMRRLLPYDVAPAVGYARGPVAAFTVLTWSATLTTNGLIWADTLLLGSMRSSSAVGVYQVATRVVMLVTAAAVPIATAFAPRITDLIGRKEWGRLAGAYQVATVWSVRICLPFLAVCALASHQVLDLFGSSFAIGGTVTLILIVGKAVDTGTGPCGMVLNMSSHVGTNAVLNVIALITNIVLNLILIPPYGIVGAAVAWTASLILLNVARVLSVRRLLGLTPWSPALGAALLVAVPGALLALALNTQLSGRELLLADAIVILASYALLTRLVQWSPDDSLVIQTVLPRLRPRSLPLRVEIPSRRGTQTTKPAAAGGLRIPLDELVSPLRYDILLRADFMGLIAEHRELARHDRAAFLRMAKAHPYYRWYSEIAWTFYGRVRRTVPVDISFSRRVGRSIALYDSFQKFGFDPDFPITVRRVSDTEKTVSGKLIANRYIPIDGCHRLALLINAGLEELTPDMFTIKAARIGPPRDNSARVLPFSRLTDAEYVAFIARGYGVDAEDEVSLLFAVAQTNPAQLDEIRSILKVDRALMSADPAVPMQSLPARSPLQPSEVGA